MGLSRRGRELFLADTSFVSAWRTNAVTSSSTAQWPEQMVRRIEDATVFISVVTVAEVRAGHLKARWGARRRLEAERWLGQYERCDVDQSVADAWAKLKEATRRRGRPCGDNDLWIAATGFARGIPVLTCDRDFLGMRNAGVDVIHLSRHLRREPSATG